MYDATLEATSGNGWLEVQLVLDDDQNNPLASMKQKPGTGRGIKFAGHISPGTYAEGVHTVDIEYKKAGGGGSVKIKDAKITIWRVF
jgi:hypothetical protein